MLLPLAALTIRRPTCSQFVNLSYIQAQHDYLAGQYPVIREDAAQMAALQMQAEHGPTLAGDAAGFEAALEKYMVKQASQRSGGSAGAYWQAWQLMRANVHTSRPPVLQILTSRPRAEWIADVGTRYKALAQFSKEDARLQVCMGATAAAQSRCHGADTGTGAS